MLQTLVLYARLSVIQFVLSGLVGSSSFAANITYYDMLRLCQHIFQVLRFKIMRSFLKKTEISVPDELF